LEEEQAQALDLGLAALLLVSSGMAARVWSRAAALLVAVAACVAGPPIPSRYDGFALGRIDAAVHVEAFYDLMCPNCRDSWPAVRKMLDALGGPVRLTLHAFPLPYHRNAYLTAQAAQALGASGHANASAHVFAWTEAVFAAQGELGNGATESLTTSQVKRKLEGLAKSSTGQDVTLFTDAADGAARVSWKYACYRGVFGTPTYLVNGVPAPDDSGSWDADQWIKFVSGLLHAPAAAPLGVA
jgi:protein-disulfide isomerase